MSEKGVSYVLRLSVLPIVVAFLVCCACIQGSDVWPLVLTGTPIPGTAGYRLSGFFEAPVNASGTIVFPATFTTPEKITGQGVFKIENGELKRVMLSGETVPDSPGDFFGNSGSATINSRGDIAFIANTTGPRQVIFIRSASTWTRVVDLNGPVPGVEGGSFQLLTSPIINDLGDVVFGADFSTGSGAQFTSGSGVFLYSHGVVSAVSLHANRDYFALNNLGEVAFKEQGSPGISLYSAGTSQVVISFPQTVPGVSSTIGFASNLFLSDDRDIVFTAEALQPGPRGSFVYSPAVVRWHSGVLEKIAASGDSVPRFDDSKFTISFRAAGLSRSAVLFSATTDKSGDVVGRYEGGELSTIAGARDFIDGIGTLDLLAQPDFDAQDGKSVTFLANAAMSTSIGIYAAVANPKYTLRFPHIADGGGDSGNGWQTTFALGNRSADPAATTISFYDDSGTPLYLKVAGQEVSQVSLVVPGRGVASIQTEGGPQLKTGWAVAETDASLSGIAIFGLLNAGHAASEVGSPASLPLRSFSVFVQVGGATATGVALGNPNTVEANVTLILRDANSTEVAQTSLVLPPMGHIGRYVNELFPNVAFGQFEGKVEVVSTQAIAALTLRQHDLAFTSLPVIP